MCQYIRDKSFIPTPSWLISVSISETTIILSHNARCSVPLYQRYQFKTQPILVTLCQYMTDKSFTLTHCRQHGVSISEKKFYPHILLAALCHYIRDNSFILIYLGYTVSVYHRNQYYPHTLLDKLYQYIRENNLTLTNFWVHCSVYQRQYLYPHTLLAALGQYIRDNSFILSKSTLHSVKISQKIVLSSRNIRYTVQVYQKQQGFPDTLLATLC